MRGAAILLSVTVWTVSWTPAVMRAQAPDLSGVYFPILRDELNRAGGPTPGSPPSRPTQGSPFGDGRQGRDGAPSLTPEYMAKWEIMRKTRVAGSPEYDNFIRCLPLGTPSMMLSNYPMEVVQHKDKIIYPRCDQMGWDVGSGSTESMCKAITRRLRQRGARWDTDHAEAIMALESLEQCDAWGAWRKMQIASRN